MKKALRGDANIVRWL